MEDYKDIPFNKLSELKKALKKKITEDKEAIAEFHNRANDFWGKQ